MDNFYVIFDTNILYRSFNKFADFNEFSFSSTFEHILNRVNELDIYEKVNIVIPSVVWNEMTEQEIKKHNEKLDEFKENIEKWIFPEISITRKTDFDYKHFVKQKVEEYRKEISSNVNHIINLPLPTSNRFDSIVARAFDKKPPFEGIDKKSDKGFKDALLWESILEFAESEKTSQYILYTKDKIFSETLEFEFNSLFESKESSIYICHDESEVDNVLKAWAKEIDSYAFIPETHMETSELEKWLSTDECLKQLKKIGIESFVDTSILTFKDVKVDEVINISNGIDVNETTVNYDVEARLNVTYGIHNNSDINVIFYSFLEINSHNDEAFEIVNFEGSYEDEFDETE